MRVRLALYAWDQPWPRPGPRGLGRNRRTTPHHYTVVSENDQVRILKVHYGPHEKSVMHSHPASVAVFLTDTKGQFSYPDGKTESFAGQAGDAQYGAATTHLPENTGDNGMDVIVVELKGKAAKAEMK